MAIHPHLAIVSVVMRGTRTVLECPAAVTGTLDALSLSTDVPYAPDDLPFNIYKNNILQDTFDLPAGDSAVDITALGISVTRNDKLKVTTAGWNTFKRLGPKTYCQFDINDHQPTAYGGTSSTSRTIGVGSKVFVTSLYLGYVPGTRVRVMDAGDPTTNWMEGYVTDYNIDTDGELTVDVDTIGGSGTIADWVMTVTGIRGATGATGATGLTGADGTDGSTVLSGATAPDDMADGVNGDFYIRTSNWNIYGPKAGGVWPAGVSLIGPAGADGADGTDGVVASIVAGTNITVDNTDPANPIISSTGGGGGLTYTEVTTTSQTAAVNNGYIANNVALVTVTLPAVAAIGEMVAVQGKGAGGWRLAQPSGHEIKFASGGNDGIDETTAGTGGSVSSTDRYDRIEVQCITADSVWAATLIKGELVLV